MTDRQAIALELRKLGRMSYLPCLELMRTLVDQRISGESGDCLLLVEHEAVYTRGRRHGEGEIQDQSISVLDVERGGRITYHGEGQIVLYPIVQMSGKGRDLHLFLRLLEDTVIDTLASYGLDALRDPQGSGVFVGGHKIASIGIAVRRWVSFHGLAMNVTTDLDAFRAIRPCGLKPELMTKLATLLEGAFPESIDEVGNRLVQAFRAGFQRYPR